MNRSLHHNSCHLSTYLKHFTVNNRVFPKCFHLSVTVKGLEPDTQQPIVLENMMLPQHMLEKGSLN